MGLIRGALKAVTCALGGTRYINAAALISRYIALNFPLKSCDVAVGLPLLVRWFLFFGASGDRPL